MASKYKSPNYPLKPAIHEKHIWQKLEHLLYFEVSLVSVGSVQPSASSRMTGTLSAFKLHAFVCMCGCEVIVCVCVCVRACMRARAHTRMVCMCSMHNILS